MEIEARFINLSQKEIEGRLAELGAKKVFETMFREWLFFYPKWENEHRRVRVRTDGKTTWLTYKANATWAVDSTEEVEFTVSSPEEAVKLIKATGIPQRRYQEKKRIEYALDDIIFDLDFWPKIPMVLEIEAPTEEKVKRGAELLGLKWKDAIFIDQFMLHKEYYGIDLLETKKYVFDNNSM